jgi:hypothetical protein
MKKTKEKCPQSTKKQKMRKEVVCTECPEHVEGQADDTQEKLKITN